MVKQPLIKKCHYRVPRHGLARMAGVDQIVYVTDQIRSPDPEKVIRALPKGSIVVLRNYHAKDRLGLAIHLRNLTRAQGLLLVIAGDKKLAHEVGADGIHLPSYQLASPLNASGFQIVTAACHNKRDLWRARRMGVHFAFVSPIFKTRSHKGARCLGIHRAARLMAGSNTPAIALGGVNAHTAKQLKALPLSGIAAIDGLKRKT